MKQKETKVNKIMIYTDLTSHDVLLSYPKKVRKHTVLEVKTDGTTQIIQIKKNGNKARMYVWSEQKLKMIWALRKKNQKSKMSNGWTWHL